jgi:3-mercaptopyruvate sulfurtransferase SseA
MARLLHSKGYKEVRPLLGGLDAWLELGYPTERHAAVAVPLTTIAAEASAK